MNNIMETQSYKSHLKGQHHSENWFRRRHYRKLLFDWWERFQICIREDCLVGDRIITGMVN